MSDKKREAAEKKNKNRDLGTLKKKHSSGMWETTKGDFVPSFPYLEAGNKVEIKNGAWFFPDKEDEEVPTGEVTADQVAQLVKQNEALMKQNEELAKIVGEKGSDVKKGEEK